MSERACMYVIKPCDRPATKAVQMLNHGAGEWLTVWHCDEHYERCARAAASNNREFLMQLARETRSSDSIETRIQRRAVWFRHGLVDFDELAKAQKVQ